MTKVTTEPKVLYRFVAPPGIEVKGNLVFDNDDVAWKLREYRAEEHVPSPSHTNDVIGAYVTAGQESISIVISTGCEGTR